MNTPSLNSLLLSISHTGDFPEPAEFDLHTVQESELEDLQLQMKEIWADDPHMLVNIDTISDLSSLQSLYTAKYKERLHQLCDKITEKIDDMRQDKALILDVFVPKDKWMEILKLNVLERYIALKNILDTLSIEFSSDPFNKAFQKEDKERLCQQLEMEWKHNEMLSSYFQQCTNIEELLYTHFLCLKYEDIVMRSQLKIENLKKIAQVNVYFAKEVPTSLLNELQRTLFFASCWKTIKFLFLRYADFINYYQTRKYKYEKKVVAAKNTKPSHMDSLVVQRDLGPLLQELQEGDVIPNLIDRGINEAEIVKYTRMIEGALRHGFSDTKLLLKTKLVLTKRKNLEPNAQSSFLRDHIIELVKKGEYVPSLAEFNP